MQCLIKSVLIIVVSIQSCTVLAQLATYGFGRPATPEEINSWPVNVDPTGKALPEGGGSAREGSEVYAKYCAVCHGAVGNETDSLVATQPFAARNLVGGIGSLRSISPVRTTGSVWPFATTIWDYINRAMPLHQAGILSPDEVYSLVAVILYRNGIIKEDEIMDRKTLPKVEMPNRHGFFPDPPEYKRGYSQIFHRTEMKPRKKLVE